MKKNLWLAFTVLISGFCLNISAQESAIIVRSTKDPSRVIPISLSGFSGEAQSTLKFDLEVAGFEVVSPENATFLVSGSNNGQVQGRLSDKTKAEIFAKAYSGGNTRSQAHALANDIIFAVTGQKGIVYSKIAFKADLGKTSEIYVADYDGHNAVAVTSDHSDVAAPTWVPGQRKLLYCSWKNGPSQIFMHDLSSGVRQVFARYPGGNYSPAISPDGRRVAMILSKNGSPDVYVCNIDGSGLKQLTKSKDDESSPCWSPDGSTICFVGRYGKRASLFTVSANGGEPRRLSVGGVLNITEPDWSPDGKSIIFTSQMGDFKICTIPANGGDATILVSGQDPAWAANSRTVIFTREQNHKRVLSLLDVPTKRVKDVAQISAGCSQASWSK